MHSMGFGLLSEDFFKIFLCSNFPHLALEKILVSLTMKNSKAAMNFFQRVPEWYVI